MAARTRLHADVGVLVRHRDDRELSRDAALDVPPFVRLIAVEPRKAVAEAADARRRCCVRLVASPLAKLPVRFAESLRRPSAPSLKQPTREDEGASGIRSMPSLNRRARAATRPGAWVPASL